MTTWDERMASRPMAEPTLERITTLFRVSGATSGRPLRCGVYRTETGLELRLEYEDNDDLLRSQLFRGEHEKAIAKVAAEWNGALVAMGFTELTP